MFPRVKVGHITIEISKARDIDGARQEIRNLIQRTSYGSSILFQSSYGFGSTAVLRSIAQVHQSMKDHRQELYFRSRIIYIDFSSCKSKRVMQRRIAQELKLSKTMAMFEKQDEEDDFNGVDPASREAIRDVAVVIDRTLRGTSFVMVVLNGSHEEISLNRLGVPEFHDGIIIWTFFTGFPSRKIGDITSNNFLSKLRNTNIVLGMDVDELTSSELGALVCEYAASILTHHPCMRDDDRAIIINCYLYVLFLHHSFYKGTNWIWAAHGANYWIYDGIIQGARAREINKALYQEVNFECGESESPFSEEFKRKMMLYPDSPYLVYDDDLSWKNRNMPRPWISTTSRNMIFREDTKSILGKASSIFLLFKSTIFPLRLSDDLMEQCNKLRVLILSNCAFNFLSPLFRHCSTLRFLGLDHCINNYSTQVLQGEDSTTKWACLRSLWVLDLRYTRWDEILSEEKMGLIGNLMELNIEGSICWQYTAGKLEGRLPYLERLRIVKPLRKAVETSMEIDKSFIGKTKLEVLDLSGNKDMKNVPTSLSKASSLEVLVLDGCDELENVVLSNSSLRSFSFDGYGPASNWTSMDELPRESCRPKCRDEGDGDKKDVKTSLITLEGCTQLRNLFLRGLPNLMELDLSGCVIKILDFETMVVDVPMLKRLFLLGCEQLCAIRWGLPVSTMGLKEEERRWMPVHLELLCLDTRPGHTRASISQEKPNKKFGLQVHAVVADARLARSLFAPIYHAKETLEKNVFFNICISTSSKTNKEPTCDQQQHHVVAANLYDDVSTEVGNSLTRMQAFPGPPASRLDRHIEIGDGSCNVGSEMEVIRDIPNLLHLLHAYAESLHVHDTSTSAAMHTFFVSLKWCRVERCSRLDPVFPPSVSPKFVETIWASDLLMARCIWSKVQFENESTFEGLKHLHLCSCPNLEFALPVWASVFPVLETLHIMHCGSLRHVFALGNNERNINSSIRFPELTTIHLHDVPALRQICEAKMMAPELKAVRTRGCWSLRRLPALEKVHRRRRGDDWLLGYYEEGEWRKPVVEMEKDVWDALEWDGVDSDHHPSLYKAPVHSRYYKSKRLLRGTVLR